MSNSTEQSPKRSGHLWSQRGRLKSAFLALVLASAAAALLAAVTRPQPKQEIVVGSSIQSEHRWNIEDVNRDWIAVSDAQGYYHSIPDEDEPIQFFFVSRLSAEIRSATFPGRFEWEGFTSGASGSSRYFGVEFESLNGDRFLTHIDPATGKSTRKQIIFAEESYGGQGHPYKRTFEAFAKKGNVLLFAVSDPDVGLTVRFINVDTADTINELHFPNRLGGFPDPLNLSDDDHHLSARAMAISPDGKLFAIAPAWKGDQRVTEPGIDIYNVDTGDLLFRVTDLGPGLLAEYNTYDSSLDVETPLVHSKQIGVDRLRFTEDGTELLYVVTPRLSQPKSDVWHDPVVPGHDNRDPALCVSVNTQQVRQVTALAPVIRGERTYLQSVVRNEPSFYEDGTWSVGGHWLTVCNADGGYQNVSFGPGSSFLQVVAKETGETIHPIHEFENTNNDLYKIPDSSLVAYSQSKQSLLTRCLQYAQPVLKFIPWKLSAAEDSFEVVVYDWFYDWKTRQSSKIVRSDDATSILVTKDEYVLYYPAKSNARGETTAPAYIEVWPLPPPKWRLDWVACLWTLALIVGYRRFRRPTSAVASAESKQEPVT